MWLILIVVVLAAIGGFLGDLLELAAWVIGIFAVFFALMGALLYLGYRRLTSTFSSRRDGE